MNQQDVQVSEYIAKLKEFVPEFSEHWSSKDCAHNFGDESTLHGVFSEFSYLVMQKLEAGTLKNGQQLFSFIESVVVAGGEPANAACTCFLENILNRTPTSICPNSFVPYLGLQSKEFCRGWDEFTGVKTDGI